MLALVTPVAVLAKSKRMIPDSELQRVAIAALAVATAGFLP